MKENDKRKECYLVLPSHFYKAHPRGGEKTQFRLQLAQGTMIHWIHHNTEAWMRRANKINLKRYKLWVYDYEKLPFKSKRREIRTFREFRYQMVDLDKNGWIHVDGCPVRNMKKFARRCGLSLRDFYGWHPEPFEGHTLIHFTQYRYICK